MVYCRSYNCGDGTLRRICAAQINLENTCYIVQITIYLYHLDGLLKILYLW